MKAIGRTARIDRPNEESRIAAKYHNLYVEYEELAQETDAKKKHLKALKHQRAVLLAEVKFLKERYRYLSANPPPSMALEKPLSISTKTKKVKKQASVPIAKHQLARNEEFLSKKRNESAPVFDLNETWEEKEFQVDENTVKLNEMKASGCRNAGTGPSRLGKRRISWQDPVALRV